MLITLSSSVWVWVNLELELVLIIFTTGIGVYFTKNQIPSSNYLCVWNWNLFLIHVFELEPKVLHKSKEPTQQKLVQSYSKQTIQWILRNKFSVLFLLEFNGRRRNVALGMMDELL